MKNNITEYTTLKNKKILLICPIFFGYEKSIENTFVELGANVLCLSDRPYKNHLLRALTNKFPAIAKFLTELFYYRRRLKDFAKTEFDYVFVINGQTCSSRLIRSLRIFHSKARFFLYFWDSVKNRPDSLNLAEYFDDVFTFDPVDSKKYGWILRPLFFTPEYSLSKREGPYRYGLSFIATAHTDRFSIANKVFQQVDPGLGIFKYFYLQARWVYLAYKLLNTHMSGSCMRDFNFSPLDKAKIKDVFDHSLCILDIEHPKQSGLTIRTFEALGAGKKLITTNQSIKDCDFYNDKNILVVDRASPRIPDNFLKTPYIAIPEVLYNKYSVYGWIGEIFFRPH